jgi:uracil-DNA glycosylase
MKTTELPFPEVMPASEEAQEGDIFEGSSSISFSYCLSMDGVNRPEIVAKAPGGRDAKKNRKEKPKGHTDTSTKRK